MSLYIVGRGGGGCKQVGVVAARRAFHFPRLFVVVCTPLSQAKDDRCARPGDARMASRLASGSEQRAAEGCSEDRIQHE